MQSVNGIADYLSITPAAPHTRTSQVNKMFNDYTDDKMVDGLQADSLERQRKLVSQ